MNRCELGRRVHKQGVVAENFFKDYTLSLDETLLIIKVPEIQGQTICDFVWITKTETILVEVKSTIKYGNNIKPHQILGMKKMSKYMPCYYAFVIDGHVSLVTVDDVIASIKEGKKSWSDSTT